MFSKCAKSKGTGWAPRLGSPKRLSDGVGANMSASRTGEPVLEETEFAGEFSTNGQTLPIKFRASAGADCRLRIDADLVDGPTYFLAIRSISRRGVGNEEFTLTGTSADGKTTISAEHVIVLGHGHNDGRHWIQFRSLACKVTVALESSRERPFLRLWFRSFVSFRNPVVKTCLGRLMVSGEAADVKPDDTSGCVAIEAPSDDPGGDWRNKADRFLRHMHRGLSLAHGGRLQTPLLDYVHGLILERTFFDGSGFARELPVQHSLNQDPFIKALVERYERSGSLPDILWTALGWMQTDTTFDEMRFLSGMTALEAIIESQLPDTHGTIIPEASFKLLSQQIENVVVAGDTLSEEAREILIGKVRQLNQNTFSQKIHALFDHYQIPKRDFEGNVVRDLIKLRNNIIHRGSAPDGIDIWPSIVLVRELITRILLKEIGFVGRYCCYVGGLNNREFPGEIESPQKA
jgi:hypothetical protein